jgi:hypothetical protein
MSGAFQDRDLDVVRRRRLGLDVVRPRRIVSPAAIAIRQGRERESRTDDITAGRLEVA